MKDLETSNIVGSGELDTEIDLATVVSEGEFKAHELIDDVEHSRRKGNRLLIDFVDTDALGILSPSATYVITGASDFDELNESKDAILSSLKSIGIIEDSSDDGGFQIQNLVYTADIESSLDLAQVTIALGIESTEYEPEQFPGVVYRPDETSVTLLIFASGKMVITGSKSPEEAKKAFETTTERLSSLLP